MKTAIDIILDLVSSGTISNDEAKILLEEINKPPQTITVPYSSGTITTNPDWTYDPYRPGSPWYSTNTATSTSVSGTANDSGIKTNLTTNETTDN
jgi:hypothetical protein